MFETKGYVIKFGDHINTDIISPPQYMELSIEESAPYAMNAVDPDFAAKVKTRRILVAGKNFGSGSSRETSPLTLKFLGVEAIIAEFFARIFFRNAINVGLPVVECKEAFRIRDEDQIQIDYENGWIDNLSRNERYTCTKLPPHLMEIIEAGGLVEALKEKLKEDR